jgi:hypothetical protein
MSLTPDEEDYIRFQHRLDGFFGGLLIVVLVVAGIVWLARVLG